MSLGRAKRQGRIVAASLMFWGTAAPLWAADAAKPADEGIAAARRDYAAIKAATAGVEQQKLALPNSPLAVPELKTGSEEAPAEAHIPVGRPAAEKDRLHPAKRSTHWLLDAMAEKKTDASGAGRNAEEPDTNAASDSPNPREKDFWANAAALARDEKAKDERRGEEKEIAPEASSAPGVNPLSRYMADWMTPRDFELLRGTADKPAIDALIASNAAPSQSAVQITEGSVPVALGRAGGPLGSFGESASSTAPANNPYLADLPNVTTALAPALPPAALEFATPVPTNSPAALILPGPEALPETQTSTPLDELRKARDDERYFKQLKRF